MFHGHWPDRWRQFVVSKNRPSHPQRQSSYSVHNTQVCRIALLQSRNGIGRFATQTNRAHNAHFHSVASTRLVYFLINFNLTQNFSYFFVIMNEGGMGLIFSQLVYVDYFGVGGHGGCGINADREQRNNEIVAMVSRHINPSSYFLMNIDRMTDNEPNQKPAKKTTFLDNLKPTQLIRSAQYYNRNNGFIDEVNSRSYSNAQQQQHSQTSATSNTSRPNPGGNSNHNHYNGGTSASNASGRATSSRDGNQADQNGQVPKCAVCTLL